MSTKKEIENERWIRQMADSEDSCASFAVGGFLTDSGMLSSARLEKPRVFGHFVELARRSRRMSVENLAARADIDLAELLLIERDEAEAVSPRTVFQLARVFDLPTEKMLGLAGLAHARDEDLNRAALRFAARSEPSAQLSAEERDAYEEFVRVLVERTDSRR